MAGPVLGCGDDIITSLDLHGFPRRKPHYLSLFEEGEKAPPVTAARIQGWVAPARANGRANQEVLGPPLMLGPQRDTLLVSVPKAAPPPRAQPAIPSAQCAMQRASHSLALTWTTNRKCLGDPRCRGTSRRPQPGKFVLCSRKGACEREGNAAVSSRPCDQRGQG